MNPSIDELSALLNATGANWSLEFDQVSSLYRAEARPTYKHGVAAKDNDDYLAATRHGTVSGLPHPTVAAAIQSLKLKLDEAVSSGWSATSGWA